MGLLLLCFQVLLGCCVYVFKTNKIISVKPVLIDESDVDWTVHYSDSVLAEISQPVSDELDEISFLWSPVHE